MSQFDPDDIDQLLDEHDRLHSRSTRSSNWEVADQGADYMASDLGGAAPSADEAAGSSATQRFNVHIKDELGRDDNVVVEAGSEHEAIRGAFEQHDSVADVIDAYPADGDSDGGAHDEPSPAEESTLHTITTQGHQLAVTTTEEEAVATVEAYQRAGYQDLDVVTGAANADSDDHQGYPADAPWATPPPATAPDAEDEVSPGRLDDENRATDWILNHDGEPAEGARPDPDSQFVWQDGALQYDGPQVEPDEPTQVDPDAVAVYNERVAAGDLQEDAFGAAMSHQDEQRAVAQEDTGHGDEEPTLHSPDASPEQSDAAWDAAMAERGITFTSEPPRELVDRAEAGREERDQPGSDAHEGADEVAWWERDDPQAEAVAQETAEGRLSNYFTNEELADVGPNFSYGPAGEPRTRADASSEWATDPDWDGTDPFVEAYREPSPEVWEQWEKEAQGRAGDTAEAQVDAGADGDTYAGVSRGERLDDQVDQAREALGQLADDPPSAGRSSAAATSDDDDARER